MLQEKKIIVKPLHHRGNDCYGLYFKWDNELVNLAKKIPSVKYSVTNKCWYTPLASVRPGELLDVFKGKAWVDLTAFNIGKKSKPENADKEKAVTVIINTEEAKISNESERFKKQLPNEKQQALRMVEQKLTLKGYTPNTRKTYLQHFKDFMLFYYDSHPIDLNEQDIRNYLLYLIEHKKLSKSTQNQAINAIKFFYEKVMMQERKVYFIERPMKDKRLPEVLSEEEVMSIFEALDNLKHRCMLMLTYAAGLRRSELLNLRIGDVDFDRSIVFIRGGKGRKDRQSVLAQSLIPFLEQYIKEFNPKFWLFEGMQGDKYSESSLRNVLKQACAKAGIKKQVRLHMLRHSFATHLLESGTSTRYIQVLLGHESPKTTEIYAQVTRFGMDKVRSPLDHIMVSKQLRGDDE